MGSFPEILLFDLYILFSLLPSFCHQYWWMKSFLDNSCVALSIGIILNMRLFWNIPQHENRTIKLRDSPIPLTGAATVHLVKTNLVPVNAKELIQCGRIYTRVASCSSVFFFVSCRLLVGQTYIQIFVSIDSELFLMIYKVFQENNTFRSKLRNVLNITSQQKHSTQQKPLLWTETHIYTHTSCVFIS